MPLYEYICKSCHHEFEEIQKFSDLPIEICPQCGKREVVKKVSLTAFQLKGDGWYKDGYSRPAEKPKKEDTQKNEKTEKKETKSEKKKEPKSPKPKT